MDEDKVLHASRNGIHVLRFVGDIRYPLAPSVNRFIDELFRDSVPKGFAIDLTETQAIDSTSLGVLGRLANRMRECGAGRVTIVSDREDINEVLVSMGFHEVFDIVTRSGLDAGEEEPIPVQAPDRTGITGAVLEAHRALMALSEHNRELFRDLVAAIEQEEQQADRLLDDSRPR
jgi:anti-anti-sigma factor